MYIHGVKSRIFFVQLFDIIYKYETHVENAYAWNIYMQSDKFLLVSLAIANKSPL